MADFPAARIAVGLDVRLDDLLPPLARTRPEIESDGRETCKPSVERGADVIAFRDAVELVRVATMRPTRLSVEDRDPAPIDVKVAPELESKLVVYRIARSPGTDMCEGRKG